VIAPFSGRLVAKAVRWSRDRGRNGHRILRRVLTDGRHPGSFQVSSFTGRRRRDLGGSLSHRLSCEGTTTERERERRQGCQRLDPYRASWEENTHARASGQKPGARGPRSIQVRRSDQSVVKRSDPRSSHAEPQNPRGAPHGESRDSEPGAPKVRVHASCLGGRSRSDASRVFTTGRSQGLVEVEGASLKEARSTA